ncbi:MAG: DUF3168 domain-containing protein [Pseudomonadota bacterium]
MSYAAASALQAAVYMRLLADETLGGFVGTAIYDVVPPGDVPQTYVTLGPEEARDASDCSGQGADHRFTVSVVTAEPGFKTAKEAAGAISDALVDAPLGLSRGRLVSLTFLRARAVRARANQSRRIDLTFRARVDVD